MNMQNKLQRIHQYFLYPAFFIDSCIICTSWSVMELKLIYENTSNGSSPISIAFGFCIGRREVVSTAATPTAFSQKHMGTGPYTSSFRHKRCSANAKQSRYKFIYSWAREPGNEWEPPSAAHSLPFVNMSPQRKMNINLLANRWNFRRIFVFSGAS